MKSNRKYLYLFIDEQTRQVICANENPSFVVMSPSNGFGEVLDVMAGDKYIGGCFYRDGVLLKFNNGHDK